MPVNSTEAGSLSQNLRWGLRFGLFIAAIFVILATGAVLVGGSLTFRIGDSTIFASYLREVVGEICAGVVGGLIVGALRPLLRTAGAAAGVGFVAALGVTLVIEIDLYGIPHWQVDDMAFIVAFAAFTGPVLGTFLWYKAKDIQQRKRRES